MNFTADDSRTLAAKADETEARALAYCLPHATHVVASEDGLLLLRRIDRKVRLLPFRPALKDAVLLTEIGAEKIATLWNEGNPDRHAVPMSVPDLCRLNAGRYRRILEALAPVVDKA